MYELLPEGTRNPSRQIIPITVAHIADLVTISCRVKSFNFSLRLELRGMVEENHSLV